MRYLYVLLIVLVIFLSSCKYPKCYFMSSQGWATYDGSQRRFDIMWDSKMQVRDTIQHYTIVP
jgi:hypothetical protein